MCLSDSACHMHHTIPHHTHPSGHLRWDSLGEYLALAVSFEHLADVTGNKKAAMLGKSLNEAIERLLENRKSPGRKVGYIIMWRSPYTTMQHAPYAINHKP
ncbi:hypothetical protein EON63_16520 [archaeon]|nr:MAG: hypothetical protein EON63_16520 [archaeon]